MAIMFYYYAMWNCSLASLLGKNVLNSKCTCVRLVSIWKCTPTDPCLILILPLMETPFEIPGYAPVDVCVCVCVCSLDIIEYLEYIVCLCIYNSGDKSGYQEYPKILRTQD